MTQDIFVKYTSPNQYASAFQSMIDARERWRKETQLKQDYNDTPVIETPIQIPHSYEEAIAMGATDLEVFSKELHEYIDQLCEEYDIK